jgi:hypothetical protein
VDHPSRAIFDYIQFYQMVFGEFIIASIASSYKIYLKGEKEGLLQIASSKAVSRRVYIGSSSLPRSNSRPLYLNTLILRLSNE